MIVKPGKSQIENWENIRSKNLKLTELVEVSISVQQANRVAFIEQERTTNL